MKLLPLFRPLTRGLPMFLLVFALVLALAFDAQAFGRRCRRGGCGATSGCASGGCQAQPAGFQNFQGFYFVSPPVYSFPVTSCAGGCSSCECVGGGSCCPQGSCSGPVWMRPRSVPMPAQLYRGSTLDCPTCVGGKCYR